MIDVEYLAGKALMVRRKVLDMAVKKKAGHVSTSYSQAEMLVTLYYGGLLRVDPNNPHWEGRDRFILSKGQGGLGVYPILSDLGFFPNEELDRFVSPGGILGVHAENTIPGIEVLTGSLGHGLPIAVGMAHAARLANEQHFIVCLLGDGELYEGSNWEAMFTAGGRYNEASAVGAYGHLILIVDNNKQATIGMHDELIYASDGPGLYPLKEKFEAFGCTVRECNGHDVNDIVRVFSGFRTFPLIDKPLCIISHTDKGHGASVMENKRLWHYRAPLNEDLERTKKDLGME